MITETTARPFTAALLDFLNAIARGPRGGTLELHARSPAGFGYECQRPAIPVQPWFYLPPFALKLLGETWSVRVGAAVRDRSGSKVASLAALFAVFPLQPEFNRETRWRWQVSDESLAAVRARLDGFPLAPAFVLDAFEEFVALWPLVEPITDLDRARRLQRRLAEALGASTAPISLGIPSQTQTMGAAREITSDADDPAAFLPLPGSIVRQRGDPPPVVVFAEVAPERIYAIEAIEAVFGREEHAS